MAAAALDTNQWLTKEKAENINAILTNNFYKKINSLGAMSVQDKIKRGTGNTAEILKINKDFEDAIKPRNFNTFTKQFKPLFEIIGGTGNALECERMFSLCRGIGFDNEQLNYVKDFCDFARSSDIDQVGLNNLRDRSSGAYKISQLTDNFVLIPNLIKRRLNQSIKENRLEYMPTTPATVVADADALVRAETAVVEVAVETTAATVDILDDLFGTSTAEAASTVIADIVAAEAESTAAATAVTEAVADLTVAIEARAAIPATALAPEIVAKVEEVKERAVEAVEEAKVVAAEVVVAVETAAVAKATTTSAKEAATSRLEKARIYFANKKDDQIRNLQNIITKDELNLQKLIKTGGSSAENTTAAGSLGMKITFDKIKLGKLQNKRTVKFAFYKMEHFNSDSIQDIAIGSRAVRDNEELAAKDKRPPNTEERIQAAIVADAAKQLAGHGRMPLAKIGVIQQAGAFELEGELVNTRDITTNLIKFKKSICEGQRSEEEVMLAYERRQFGASPLLDFQRTVDLNNVLNDMISLGGIFGFGSAAFPPGIRVAEPEKRIYDPGYPNRTLGENSPAGREVLNAACQGAMIGDKWDPKVGRCTFNSDFPFYYHLDFFRERKISEEQLLQIETFLKIEMEYYILNNVPDFYYEHIHQVLRETDMIKKYREATDATDRKTVYTNANKLFYSYMRNIDFEGNLFIKYYEDFASTEFNNVLKAVRDILQEYAISFIGIFFISCMRKLVRNNKLNSKFENVVAYDDVDRIYVPEAVVV